MVGGCNALVAARPVNFSFLQVLFSWDGGFFFFELVISTIICVGHLGFGFCRVWVLGFIGFRFG